MRFAQCTKMCIRNLTCCIKKNSLINKQRSGPEYPDNAFYDKTALKFHMISFNQ